MRYNSGHKNYLQLVLIFLARTPYSKIKKWRSLTSGFILLLWAFTLLIMCIKILLTRWQLKLILSARFIWFKFVMKWMTILWMYQLASLMIIRHMIFYPPRKLSNLWTKPSKRKNMLLLFLDHSLGLFWVKYFSYMKKVEKMKEKNKKQSEDIPVANPIEESM